MTKHGQQVAPDGGWGWVVLVGTVLVLALTLAFPSCLGIFFTELQTEFNTSNTETSWVPAIMTAVLHAGGRVALLLTSNQPPFMTVVFLPSRLSSLCPPPPPPPTPTPLPSTPFT